VGFFQVTDWVRERRGVGDDDTGKGGESIQAQTKPLEGLVKELPPDCKEEVRDFVEFLLERRGRKRGGKLR
jgi:hypothetical protein